MPQGVIIETATGLNAHVVKGAVNFRPRQGLPFQWEGYVQNLANVDIPYLTVAVTDNGVPPLTTSQSFAVVVPEFAELTLGSVVGQPGQLVWLPLTLVSSASITNLSLTLAVPPDRINNLWFQGRAPATNVALVVPEPGHPALTLWTGPGIALQGTQSVARIGFNIPPGQTPGTATLEIHGVIGQAVDGTTLTKVVAHAGQIIVVNASPLLEALGVGQSRILLNVYNATGATYDLQTTTNLTSGWSTLGTLTLSNSIESVIWTNRLDAARYFRLQKH